jgi:hypothetical protein
MSGNDYELAVRGPAVDLTCHLAEGRDRSLSSAVFEAAGRRVAADLKGTLPEGRVKLQLAIESERPIDYRIAGNRPLLVWPATLRSGRGPARHVDLVGAMFPNSVLACFSNREGHDPTFASILSGLVEKLAVDIPLRQTSSLPHYTEVELIRLGTGEPGLREVLVHRIRGGFLTSFYESVSTRSGVSDRTIYEISQDDGTLARSHFIFYRDGKRQRRFAVERTTFAEYSVTIEDDNGSASPARTLASNAPLLARWKMALGLRDATTSAGFKPELFEMFVPEISRDALVSVRISKPGTEAPPPAGTIQAGSSFAAMQAGSLSLSRAYGYPTLVELVAPSRITGTPGI